MTEAEAKRRAQECLQATIGDTSASRWIEVIAAAILAAYREGLDKAIDCAHAERITHAFGADIAICERIKARIRTEKGE